MTSRERITALLNREIPDQMGLYEHYWGDTLRNAWPAQGYPADQTPEDYFGYDIVNCGCYVMAEPFIENTEELLESSEEWEIIRNGFGATLKRWKNKSGVPEHIGFTVTTPEVWKKYREPLLELDTNRFVNVQNAKDKIKSAREQDKYVVCGNMFVFELMRAIIGDSDFLPALLTEPEWIRDFCQVYLDFFIKHHEVLFREIGIPDGFFLYEDYGYTNGLFCSPALMSELVMPYEKAFVSFLKDYGIQVILHSCGDIREAIPQIIDAGIDCLQPMEAKAGCDVMEIAETYGSKLAYMGNIDVVALSTNDRNRIEAEIAPKLQQIAQRRIPYVFHSDHSIPPSVHLETYQYALQLYLDNCRYV